MQLVARRTLRDETGFFFRALTTFLALYFLTFFIRMPYLPYLLLMLYSTADVQSSSTILLSHHQPDSLAYLMSDKTDVINFDPVVFEDSLHQMYNSIGLEGYALSYDVFRYGMIGFYNLRGQGKLNSKNLLTIIDFTKPSTEKRFYTIDLDQQLLKFYTYVSHGKNTGENLAKSFSNTVHSNQSSLGFYVTAETYTGSKGYSLKLDGFEKGYNDNLRERAVVMHDADYVSEFWIKKNGRLGRSQGCPALPKEIAKEVIETIKNNTVIFAYYNDMDYLKTSYYLNTDNLVHESQISAKL